MGALEDAEAFARSRPPEEVGCLYWSVQPGGVVPRVAAPRIDGLPSPGHPFRPTLSTEGGFSL